MKNCYVLLGILAGMLGMFPPLIGQPTSDEKISRPFEYEGYSEANYKHWTQKSQFVEMEDGTKIAVDVLIPKDGPEAGPFPVIFQHTPYNRAYLLPKMGPVKHVASSVLGLGWGPEYDLADVYPYVKFLLSHGYVIVNADMRGTGASFGSQMPLYPQLAKDGKFLIDWIAEQSWCDGNVGMMGPSYLGWAQLMAASEHPKALKCIMPEVIVFDAYTEANCPGGIPARRWLKGFSDVLEYLSLSKYNLRKGYMPALPTIDEDGDGKLADERPLMDSLMLAGDKAPVYRDGIDRKEHWYLRATQEHTKNITVRDLLEIDARYFDSKAPEPYTQYSYVHGSPGYYLPEIEAMDIPVYHMGGWFDIFVKGTTKLYASTADKTSAKLVMTPRFHLPFVIKSYRKFLGFEKKYMEIHAIEQLRFFDRYLKGIDNNIDKEAPVYLYVMHKGWRAEDEWPIARQEMTVFYFAEDGKLSNASPEGEGVDAYEVDFTVSSNYGKDSLNRWMISEGTPGTLMVRTEWDKKSLVYETPVLEEEVEVTGHPIVEMWVSSNQDDGDVYVYLSEVDAEGKSIYVTEGMLRAGWHRLQEDDDQVDGRLDVQPELPWHGYKQEQYVHKPLANGAKRKLSFDLLPTSYAFRKGSRIRIAITGADFENFELNPGLCPDQKPSGCKQTTLSVHRSAQMPSRILLPVIPPKQKIADTDKNIRKPVGGEEKPDK